MATKKKAVKKVAAPATAKAPKASRAPQIKGGIPEGFTMPASAQVPNWDYEKGEALYGEVIAIKRIVKKAPKKGEKKDTRMLIVKETSGKLAQVWESAALSGLFDELKPGYIVFIQYEGLAPKVKGKNQMKLFTTAYKKHK